MILGDDLDGALNDAAQPRCPHCDVLMRDDEGGWSCPECRRFEPHMQGPLPPPFDGPGIHGG